MKTIEDLKKMWNVKVGNFYFKEENKETGWKKFLKEVKKDFPNPHEAYNYYHNMWYGW